MKHSVRKIICLLICLAMVLPMVPTQAFAEGLVISITNEDEFLAIADLPYGNYRLEADLDLGTIAPIAVFRGYLDGNGYTIRYSVEEKDGVERYGLFSSLDNAQINNLHLDCTMDLDLGNGNFEVGALAGYATDSALTNLTVNTRMNISGSSDNAYVNISAIASGGYFHSCQVYCQVSCHVPGDYDTSFHGIGGEAYYCSISGQLQLTGGIRYVSFLNNATQCAASVDLSVQSSAQACGIYGDISGKQNSTNGSIRFHGVGEELYALTLYGLYNCEGSTYFGGMSVSGKNALNGTIRGALGSYGVSGSCSIDVNAENGSFDICGMDSCTDSSMEGGIECRSNYAGVSLLSGCSGCTYSGNINADCNEGLLTGIGSSKEPGNMASGDLTVYAAMYANIYGVTGNNGYYYGNMTCYTGSNDADIYIFNGDNNVVCGDVTAMTYDSNGYRAKGYVYTNWEQNQDCNNCYFSGKISADIIYSHIKNSSHIGDVYATSGIATLNGGENSYYTGTVYARGDSCGVSIGTGKNSISTATVFATADSTKGNANIVLGSDESTFTGTASVSLKRGISNITTSVPVSVSHEIVGSWNTDSIPYGVIYHQDEEYCDDYSNGTIHNCQEEGDHYCYNAYGDGWFDHWHGAIHVTHVTGQGAEDSSAGWTGDMDPETGDYVPDLDPINYTLRLLDTNRQPVPHAFLVLDGQYYLTDSKGCVEIKNGPAVINELSVQLKDEGTDRYQTLMTRKTFCPIPDKVNTLQLDPQFTLRMNFLGAQDAESGSGFFSTPKIEKSGIIIDGMQMPLNFDMQQSIGSNFSFGPRVDPETGNLCVIVTTSLGSGGRHPTMSWDKYSDLRDKMLQPDFAKNAFKDLKAAQKIKTKMGIGEWDVSVIGYAEFSYGDYEWTFEKGMLGLQSSLENRWVVPIVAVPGAYWTAALLGSLTSELGGEVDDNETADDASVLWVGSVEPTIRAEGAVGYGVRAARLYIELGLGGQIAAEINSPLVSLEDSLSLTGTFDVFGEICLLSFRNRVELVQLSASWPNESSYALRRSLTEEISDGEYEMMPRTYAGTARRLARSAGAQSVYFGLEGETCYPYSKVRLLKLNYNRYLLIYTDDDLSREDADRSVLRACIGTVVDGRIQWGESVTVDPDGTGDYGFAATTSGTKAAILWQDATESFGSGEDLTPQELSNHIVMSEALLDCSGATPVVSRTAVISEAGSYPYYPNISYSFAGIRSSWVTSDNPDPSTYLEDEKETLWLSTDIGQAGKAVMENQTGISGVAQNMNYLYWVAKTGEENTLYSLSPNGTLVVHDTGDIRNLQCSGETACYTKGDEFYLTTQSTFECKDTGSAYEGVILLGNDGKAYTAQTTAESARICEIATGKALPIADLEGYLASWDAADGHIVAVLRSGFGSEDTASFLSTDKTEIVDLEVRQISCENTKALPGETVSFTAEIANRGYGALTSLPVSVTDATGTEIYTDNLVCSILPEENGSVAFDVLLPEFSGTETFTVTVLGASEVFTFGGSNLSVNGFWSEGDADCVYLTVQNTGTMDASGTVSVYEAEDLLYTEPVSLATGGTKTLEVDLGMVYDTETTLQVILEEGEDGMYVGDNTATIKISPVTLKSLMITVPQLNEGDTASTVLKAYPEGAEIPALIYSSSDETVATVDQQGNITAIRSGETEITITTESGRSFSTQITVTTTHNYGEYVSDHNATCTQNGTKTAVCKDCGASNTVIDKGSAIGHSWDAGVTTKEPTAGVEGIKSFTCGNCGETKTESIPALPTEPEETAPTDPTQPEEPKPTDPTQPSQPEETEPTTPTKPDDSCKHPSTKLENQLDASCTVTGYTGDTVCTACGSVVKRGVMLSPTGHSWTDWEVTKPATGAEEGEESRWCTVCDEEEIRSIDKLENPFVDVIAGKFYETPVLWAVENGITNGMDETHFAPDNICNRSQVVTFLWRAAGSPEPTSTNNPFTDVKEGKFYYKAVLWAVENGITNGTSATTFSPDDNCTRGQVATFLWRTLNEPNASSSSNPFTDVEKGKFYYDAVLWAVDAGVTNGMTTTTFVPNNACTRGQIVTFLYRALG